MNGNTADNDPIRRYLETATPKEQREFSEALLASRSKANSGTPSIPESTVRASRLLFVALVIFWVISLGWSEDLVLSLGVLTLLGAVACFPNETAAATGRLGLRTAVTRPSHPWILFVIVWLALLFFGLAAASTWSGAA